MDRFLFHWLNTKPADLVMSDESYNYYSMLVNGYRIGFAKDKYRPDGQRMFILGDEFAKCLGFFNYAEMRYRLRRLQYWRGMLTLRAIKNAIAKGKDERKRPKRRKINIYGQERS